MTTPQDLENFAVSLRAMSRWTPTIQQQLMDLIREPAMTWRGQLIPPNNPAVAMDNLFRCRPTRWDMGMEAVGNQAQARFRLWYQSLTDTAVRLHCEVTSGDLPLTTNALALTAATARVWAFIERAGVRDDFQIPDNV